MTSTHVIQFHLNLISDYKKVHNKKKKQMENQILLKNKTVHVDLSVF